MSNGNSSSTGNDDDSELAEVSIYKGITYAERNAGEMKLDLFIPSVDGPPLVVYIHGGGWISETRDNIPEPERYASEWGCAIASVSYRLAEVPDEIDPELPIDPNNPTPRGVFPDQFVDVKAAIRWLRANADEYGYDAERVATWGASAGGHLAALAGVIDNVGDLTEDVFSTASLQKDVAPDESGAVQAVVTWYGISNLTRFSGRPEGPETFLIGGPKSQNEDKFEAASPVTYVSPDSPPFLLMHGREDTVCSVEQSRVLYEALNEAHVDTVYYELHDLGHVFTHGGREEIESERTAMTLLDTDPTPAQSIYKSGHLEAGSSAQMLVERKPPAGADTISEFLDSNLI